MPGRPGTANLRWMLVHQDRAGELPAPIDARIYAGRAARIQTPSDPLKYPWGVEHRDLAELEVVAAQLIGKPVTLLHPDDLISEGAQAEVVGKIRSARVDGDHILVEFEITEPKGRAAIDGGVHELSLGYTCRLDESRYQRDTVVDHLALVPRARCGESCALRADCASGVQASSIQACTCKTEAMRYPGKTVSASATHEDKSASEQIAPAGSVPGPANKEIQMDEIQKKLDAALAEVENLKKRADKLESERDEARRDLKAAEKSRSDAQDAAKTAEKKAEDAEKAAIEKARQDAATDRDALVATRVELIGNANAVLGIADKDGTAVNRSKMSDHDIKVAIVKHVDGDDLTTEKRADYVQAAYEGAVKRHTRAAASHGSALSTVAQGRKDALENTNQSTSTFVGADAERRARLAMINSGN